MWVCLIFDSFCGVTVCGLVYFLVDFVVCPSCGGVGWQYWVAVVVFGGAELW